MTSPYIHFIMAPGRLIEGKVVEWDHHSGTGIIEETLFNTGLRFRFGVMQLRPRQRPLRQYIRPGTTLRFAQRNGLALNAVLRYAVIEHGSAKLDTVAMWRAGEPHQHNEDEA